MAGLLLDATGTSLSISAFDYEVSSRAEVEIEGTGAGRALVSGKLLADITRALPDRPVEFVAENGKVMISCGSSQFTLPTMPDIDYPRLPDMPALLGTVDSAEFARAVSQVAIAAGRDDSLPMLTGIRIEVDGAMLTLAATDRYRLAVRELPWSPVNQDGADIHVQVLVAAKTLSDTAKGFTGGGQISIALSVDRDGASDGVIGFVGPARRTTSRLLDAQFPPFRALIPESASSSCEVDITPLSDAVKRVSLVAAPAAPLRMAFAPGAASLSAGESGDGDAEETVEVNYEGEPLRTAFNPRYLLDGVGAIGADTMRMSFTGATKPVVLRPAGAPEREVDSYLYLIMPVRLPG